MMFLRKYATSTGQDVYITMVKRGVVDHAVSADWTPATGDVKVSIDGGAAANIGTLPTAVAMGNSTIWKFVFTTGELTGKIILVTIADSATKAVEDSAFIVETYGHASAMYRPDFTVDALGAVMPTTAGRTLDVSATGEAGIDWANVGSPTTSLALTGTTIATTQKVDVDTIKTNPVVNGGTITFPTGATLASTTNITAAAGCAVSSLGANVITAASAASDFGAEIQALITGGAYALSTDANGRVRIVDGTGTGELNTSSGNVFATLVDGPHGGSSATLTLDALVLTAGFEPTTNNAIADAVWDELLSGHAVSGSTGAALSAAGSAGDPWITALPGAYSAGTAGYIVGTNLNATVSSRASQTSVGTPIDISTGADLASNLEDINSFISTQLDATISSRMATYTQPTGFLAATFPGTVSSYAGADTSGTTTLLSRLSSTRAGYLDNLSGGAAALEATAQSILADTGTDGVVVNATGLATDAVNEIRAAITGGAYAIDTDANGRIRIVDGTATGELDTASGLVKISGTTQTFDALQTALNSAHGSGSWATATGFAVAGDAMALTTSERNSVADALLDRTNGIESGVTFRQAQRAMAAILAGLIADAGTDSETYKGIGQGSGGTTRVTAIVGLDGNRSAITLNL